MIDKSVEPGGEGGGDNDSNNYKSDQCLFFIGSLLVPYNVPCCEKKDHLHQDRKYKEIMRIDTDYINHDVPRVVPEISPFQNPKKEIIRKCYDEGEERIHSNLAAVRDPKW